MLFVVFRVKPSFSLSLSSHVVSEQYLPCTIQILEVLCNRLIACESFLQSAASI